MDLEDGFECDASIEKRENYGFLGKTLENLRMFDISGFQMCRFLRGIRALKDLIMLDINGFQMRRYLPGISLFKNLTVLNLYLSGVQKMSDFSRLPNLRMLTIQDSGSLPISVNFDDCLQPRHLSEENVNLDAISSVNNMANSEEWIFLVSSLFMEIFSVACDQLSSPSKPRYALFGMLLAIVALLTCTGELIYKGRKRNVIWRKKGFYMLFGSASESYALVGGIAQCVCSIIQYVYYIRHGDNPVKLSILPTIFLICLIAEKLIRKRMQTTYETHQHTS